MHRRRNAGSRRNRGYTLLEVFVVLVIAGVLLVVILPALQESRDHARRIQCANNLRNIGLALQNYYDGVDCYPPGYVSRDVSDSDPAFRDPGPGYAWGAMILPQLDQTPLYSMIDFSNDAVATGAGAPIVCMQCPADPDRPMASFVGCYGFGDMDAAPGLPAGRGILYRNSHVRDFDIRDGLSNTFIVGERAAVHDFVPGAHPVSAEADWLAAIRGKSRPIGLPDAPGLRAGHATYVLGAVGKPGPHPVDVVHCRTNYVGSFSSRHPGGAEFLLADGSVHFVSSDIDPVIYRRLGQCADGQPAVVPLP